MCRDVPSHRAEYSVLDVRPGGRYVIEIKLPDGGKYRGSGVFREVVPPERLVFSWFWERVAPDGEATPESDASIITIQLAGRGSATEIALTHSLIENEQARRDSEQGWNGCLDALSALLVVAR
jgi:uncharacterized protein YndB with AHSA1/START domain